MNKKQKYFLLISLLSGNFLVNYITGNAERHWFRSIPAPQRMSGLPNKIRAEYLFCLLIAIN
ncbi:MAG: hypothetical protein D3906_12555 [Candidatus Electrothrix sp. AUS1_2]|nr:hypothetical protein [Candidatus Electrothrix sp. AUS1_2]